MTLDSTYHLRIEEHGQIVFILVRCGTLNFQNQPPLFFSTYDSLHKRIEVLNYLNFQFQDILNIFLLFLVS